jgi:hypothetical protein
LKDYCEALDEYREELEETLDEENPLVVDDQLMKIIVKKSYTTRYLPALAYIHQKFPHMKLNHDKMRKVGMAKRQRLRSGKA